MIRRTVDRCPYRIVAAGHDVCCGLLQQLAGTVRLDTAVNIETCQTCVETRPLQQGHPNAVVASLLFERTEPPTTIDESAQQQLQRRQLQDYARRHLDVLTPDANSLISAPKQPPSGTPRRPHRKRWRHVWSSRLPRIGIVGWDTKTGLGHQNLELWKHLRADRWLVPVDVRHRPALSITRRAQAISLSVDAPVHRWDAWLDGLDWIVFAETEYFRGLAQRARQRGVRVACVPNHESLCIGHCDWLHCVDLMVCPTQLTGRIVSQLQQQFGFPWHTVMVPWPVDVRQLRFRPRTICRRFLFVNGTGGMRGFHSDGSRTSFCRKGLDVMLSAAALVPHVPVTVISQAPAAVDLPDNVIWRNSVADRRQLYDAGDVCVQPSHWEGIGLQLLECQASGLPLITTDAPPMNEYQPLAAIPVTESQTVSVFGNQAVAASRIAPDALATVLDSVYGSNVRQASQSARRFVSARHSWKSAVKSIFAAMATVTSESL